MDIVTIDDAMDVVDIYGPDRDFWPNNVRDALDDLIATDEEFASYVEEARRIDDMLNNWDEHKDGAAINLDDMDWDEDEEDDEDDGPSTPLDDTDIDGPISKGANNGDASPIGWSPPTEEDEPEEEEDRIVEIDLDQIDSKDLDDMLAEVIRIESAHNSGEKYVVFTRDYDRLVDIKADSHVSIDPIDQHVAQTVGPLMKDLRRMIAARSQVKRTPGMRKGRLHSANLHRILAGDDRVFTRRDEASSLDTAISLVLDCSGSMHGGRLQLAAQTAYALGSVLNKLGIAFECVGFTTIRNAPETRDRTYQQELEDAARSGPVHRAGPIIMPKFKTFDERWTTPVQRRFALVHNNRGQSLGPGISMDMTPEGCGNEFAARRLLARKEARKIMITMTDGEPGINLYSPDYGADRRHAQNMVQSITAAGVDIIGIGIQHAGPTSYYPNSMVINSVSEMPAQLLGLLKKLLIGK